MDYSPPKKTTVELSLALVIVGIILGITAYQGLIEGDFVFLNLDINQWCFILGFGMTALGWLYMYLGIRLKGL